MSFLLIFEFNSEAPPFIYIIKIDNFEILTHLWFLAVIRIKIAIVSFGCFIELKTTKFFIILYNQIRTFTKTKFSTEKNKLFIYFYWIFASFDNLLYKPAKKRVDRFSYARAPARYGLYCAIILTPYSKKGSGEFSFNFITHSARLSNSNNSRPKHENNTFTVF